MRLLRRNNPSAQQTLNGSADDDTHALIRDIRHQILLLFLMQLHSCKPFTLGQLPQHHA